MASMFVAGDKVWEKLFNPLSLFANGEQGVWYDPSDLTTMFQDTAGTIPAGFGEPVGLIRDKSGNGNHASQATATARPTLGRMPATGRRNLLNHSNNIVTGWSLVRVTSDWDAITGVTRVRETTGEGWHYTDITVPMVEGQPYVFSAEVRQVGTDRLLWLRPAGSVGDGSVIFNLVLGTVSRVSETPPAYGIEPVGDGFYRVHVTGVAQTTGNLICRFEGRLGSSGSGSSSYLGDPNTGWDIRRVQVELSSALTPHQKVTSPYDVTEGGVQSLSYLYRDPVDDALPWTAPAGSYDIVHIPLTGPATVLTEQALSGSTNFLLAENTRAYLAIDRRLTGAEIDALAAYYGASA